VRRHFNGGAFVSSSSGVTLTDLDGNQLYDVTGSYGVNVFGNDFYKECIARGSERVQIWARYSAATTRGRLQCAPAARDLRHG